MSPCPMMKTLAAANMHLPIVRQLSPEVTASGDDTFRVRVADRRVIGVEVRKCMNGTVRHTERSRPYSLICEG